MIHPCVFEVWASRKRSRRRIVDLPIVKHSLSGTKASGYQTLPPGMAVAVWP